TDRKQAEEENARLIAILEATPDLVGIADLNGTIKYTNHAGRKMVGLCDEDDMTLRNISEFHPPEVLEKIINPAIQAAMQEGSWMGEAVLNTLEGKEIPISQVILAHKDKTGKVAFVSTIARDITERTRIDRMKNEFI